MYSCAFLMLASEQIFSVTTSAIPEIQTICSLLLITATVPAVTHFSIDVVTDALSFFQREKVLSNPFVCEQWPGSLGCEVIDRLAPVLMYAI